MTCATFNRNDLEVLAMFRSVNASWARRNGVILVGTLLFLALLTGCSDVQMKSTPIWDGEYTKAIGPAQDRVNLWPLLYWRAPALSVFWPLVTMTDEANSFTPIYEYRKAGKDLAIINPIPAAPPILAHFVGKDKYWRVLDVDWDGNKKTLFAFPVYYQHFNSKGSGETDIWTPLYMDWTDVCQSRTVGVFGPLFLRSWDKDSSTWGMPWPFVDFWTSKAENGSCIFPAYFWNSDGKDDKTLITPFGGYSTSDSERSIDVGGPLYYSSTSTDERYCTVLWPLSHRWKNSHSRGSLVFPIYYWKDKGENDKRLVSLLGAYRQSSDGRKIVAGPLYYENKSKDGDVYHRSALWPILNWWKGAQSSGNSIVPLYYWNDKGQSGHTFISPLGVHQWSPDRKKVIAGPIYYGNTSTDGKSAYHSVLWPIVHWWKESDSHGSAILPFYSLWRDGKDKLTFASLLGGCVRSTDTTLTDILGPVYYESYSAKDDRMRRAALWPLWNQGRRHDSTWSTLFPLYYSNTDGDDFSFMSIPYSRSQDGRSSETAILLNVIGWSAERDSRDNIVSSSGHHVFPLYSWSTNRVWGWRSKTTGEEPPEESHFSLGVSLLASWSWNRDDVETTKKNMSKNFRKTIDFFINEYRKSATQDDKTTDTNSIKSYEPNIHDLVSTNRNTRLLTFLYTSSDRITGFAKPLKGDDSVTTGSETYVDSMGQKWGIEFSRNRSCHIPFLYKHNCQEGGDHPESKTEIVWRLFDGRTEPQKDGTLYTRQRVLWRLLHRESQGDRVSTDVFPFVAYDRDDKEGWMQWSFAGGFVGWKNTGEGKTLKVFWIPIPLGGEKVKTEK
jgi:hypothetical protein